MKPPLILDVRSSQEFLTSHLEGAVNIPHDQLQQKLDSLANLDELPSVFRLPKGDGFYATSLSCCS